MSGIWTPHRARHREASPAFWALFCAEWLRLDRPTTEAWWHALQRARWSRAVALRSIVLGRAALGVGQGSMQHFVTTNVSPQVLMAVLEELIREGLLPARLARQIEDQVLMQTHISGLWK